MAAYLKAANCRHVSADIFFSGKQICNTSKQPFYAKPSPELRAEYAIAFEKDIWSRTDKDRLNALKNGEGADFSYLQCFYVSERKDYFGNSLSGEAYDYCKRMFTKSSK